MGKVRCDLDLADTPYSQFIGGLCTGRLGAGTGRLIAEAKVGSITIRLARIFRYFFSRTPLLVVISLYFMSMK